MRRCCKNGPGLGRLCLAYIILGALTLLPVSGQWMPGPPVTPMAQRSALSTVRSQVGWLQNATRVAAGYGAQGCGNVWQTFDGLRQAYGGLKSTLNQQQLASGANQWAELDAGLDIIEEAFSNYQDDISSGQPVGPALSNLCRVVREGSALWLQELNKTANMLRVGWGG